MQKEISDVEAFMVKAGRPMPHKPTIPTDDQKLLRCNLILEEALEFTRSLGCEVDIKGIELKAFKETNYTDLTESLDAILDLLYVVYGAAIELGLTEKLQQGWNEVQRSNMTKFIDGYKREDGKWVKGPSYSPANLKMIMDEAAKERKDKKNG